MTPLRQRVARILVQPSRATRLRLLSLFVHPFFAQYLMSAMVPLYLPLLSPVTCVAQLSLVFSQWTTCFWWTFRIEICLFITSFSFSGFFFLFLVLCFGRWNIGWSNIFYLLFNQDSFTLENFLVEWNRSNEIE